MTPDLATFLTSVRAEANTALARLDAVDPALLSPDLRDEYETARGLWLGILAMTEADVIELHEAACSHAGRQLTMDELRGLLGRQ